MSDPNTLGEQALARIVDALVDGYARDAGPAGRGSPALPPREQIVDVINQVRRLLFPGYYAHEPLPEASRRFHVGTWVCTLYTNLVRIVRLAFSHEEPAQANSATRRARIVGRDFLEALPDLRRGLLLDAEAAVAGDPAARNIEEVILTYPGFEAISIFRVAHWLFRAKVPYLPRAMTEHAHTHTGIDLHPGATIGERFFIDHGTGVVVGETTEIGRDVKIYQGVTLGALSVDRRLAGTKRHPTIEDDVVIYAGATVLGGETVIGRGAVIGGNVWLTASVDPNVTVVESPPAPKIRARGEK